MIGILEFITAIWTTAWAVVALRRLLTGVRASIVLVSLIFYGFYSLPLIADLLLGLPDYSHQPLFYDASRDALVRVLYCIFISSIQPLWLRKRPASEILLVARADQSKSFQGLLLLGALTPILLLFIAPQPELYLQYGFIIGDNVPLPALVFHEIMSAATMFAVLFMGAFIAFAERPRAALVTISPLIAASVWLNGKRNILALAMVIVLVALWYRGELKKKNLIKALSISVLLLAAFSYEYQSTLRGKSPTSSSREELQDDIRGDYSRDSRLKMAFYAQLNPTKAQILEYPGQSFLFDFTFWVPRTVWPSKPYPYAVYFTPAMLGLKTSVLGWGMTTSILDECIANFGWVGLLLGPLFMSFICRLGDSCNDRPVNLLTVLIASLFLAVQLPSFMVLFLAWLALVVKAKRKQRLMRKALLLECRETVEGLWVWRLKRA
jgi:hypothetical protein